MGGVEVEVPESELIVSAREHSHSGVYLLRRHDPWLLGLERDDLNEGVDVNVLIGEPATHDIVGVGHDLDARARQV